MPSLTRRLRHSASRLLPHNNPRCTAPPGSIVKGPGRPVLVPSLMRSGTHVLIDLILNNFSAYRRSPLYVDLDHHLLRGGTAGDVLAGGSYLLKSHHPGTPHLESQAGALREIAAAAFVIQPVRDLEAVFRSQSAWGQCDRGRFLAAVSEFDAFWSPFAKLQIRYEDMTAAEPCLHVLRAISEFTGQPVPAHVILPPMKQSAAQALFHKTLTRLLGRRSPVINTTIGFATA